MGPRHTSISTTFVGSMVIVAVLAIGVIGYFWIFSEYDEFAVESARLRSTFLEQQRAMIRNEVDKVIDYIEYRRSTTEERLEASLRERVAEAHGIATHLYESYRGELSRRELEHLVKEVLRPIRFNNGRGYYFVVRMDGVELLYPVKPEFENNDLIDLQDRKGNFVIRDEIEVVRERGEGFVRDYWPKPNAEDEMIYPKMTYVRSFEPFDWYLGTGEYLDDFEHDLKEELLDRIARVRFGSEGYVFVNEYDGNALVTNGKRVREPRNLWNLTDPDGVKVIQEERKAVDNPEGDFIDYKWNKLTSHRPAPKVSFIKGIPDWEWMIGAGVYLDEVDQVIAAKRKQLRAEVRARILRIVVILLSLGLFILLLTRYFFLRMKRGIGTFSAFFERAATESITIDESQLHFSEFAVLAGAANRMIEDRIQAEEDKKQLQERLARSRKMEALGLLTGGVAHDLNNILAGIVTYPELMLMNLEPGSKLKRPLEIVHESGLRAAAVVADLLDASRAGQGVSEVLNINTSIERYLGSPEHRGLTEGNPGVSIHCYLDEDVHNIRCSRVHLGKTLMNLVANAVEAISGSGKVAISTRNTLVEAPIRGYEEIPAGEYVVLTVADSGSGIAESDLTRIFEPFFTKKVLGRSGTGLGLTVVWHTVRDHGGYVDVTSGTGGTVFDLYFPISTEEEEEEPAAAAVDEYRGDGEQLLVVEDEPGPREIACALLERLGYRVEAVASGEEAVEWLRERTADLVILDMILGRGMNGRQTFEKIREIHPGQRAIIASGFAETEDVKRAQELGAGALVRKPYRLVSIAMAVHQELRRSDE